MQSINSEEFSDDNFGLPTIACVCSDMSILLDLWVGGGGGGGGGHCPLPVQILDHNVVSKKYIL